MYSKRKKYTKSFVTKNYFCTSLQARCKVPMNATKAVSKEEVGLEVTRWK
jgi:hypothetical protein